ncbi:MAG: hypothetical protein IPN94_04875 [Sphingobacteriales bacterium]|nr:hypothetical protein [Sphingobacteriales bacterium]
MKHFSAILLLFVCLFSTPQLFAQTATNNKWETYEDEEGNFSIDFPAEPERETSEEDDENLGKMTIIEWSATNQESPNENVYYNLTCKISNKNIIFSDPDLADAFIEGMMRGLKREKSVELINQKQLTYNNYPAVEYTAYYKDNKIYGTTRMCLVENKIVIMSAFAENKTIKSAQPFFESLTILNPEDTAEQPTCEDRYFLSFPAEPKSEVQQRDASDVDLGYICIKTLEQTDNSNKITYTAIYMDYPFTQAPLTGKDLDYFYDKITSRYVKKTDGTILIQRDYTIEKMLGKEFVIEASNKGTYLKYRMLRVKNSLYMYGIEVDAKKELNNPKVTDFLASFKLLDAAKNRKTEETICEDAYTLAFPGTPKDMQMNVPSAIGELKMCMKMVEQSNTTAYAGYYVDYPKSYKNLSEEELNDVYEISINVVVGKLKAEIVTQTNCTIEGYKAIEFIAKAQEGKMWVKYKLVLVDNRMYMYGQFAEAQTDFDTKESTTFFNSFKIVKK